MRKFLNPYLILLFVFLCSGCNQQVAKDDPVDSDQGKTKGKDVTLEMTLKTAEQTAVIINNQKISFEAINNSLSVALFDLEWRNYQLRKIAVEQMIEIAYAGHKENTLFHTQSFLTPPSPPRISMPIDSRATKGSRDGFIQLSVFCSYQSSHCSRMQNKINQLLKKYDSYLGVKYYDFPQKYHRYASQAAIAASCAAAQNTPWAFQDSLYASADQLNDERFTAIARQLNLNLDRFKDCLKEPAGKNALTKDLALAKSFGFSKVPVVLVNGLYIIGSQDMAVYDFYINKELAKKGVELTKQQNTTSAIEQLQRSKLPLTLAATFLQPIDSDNKAVIKNTDSGKSNRYKENEIISEQVVLLQINKERAIIDNNGTIEYIDYQPNSPKKLKTPDVQKTISDKRKASQSTKVTVNTNQSTGRRSQKALPTKSKMLLSQSWLEQQLLNQSELEKSFVAAEHQLEGHHVVRLENINDNEFYQTLGLRSGDVLTRVANDWVYEGNNPLWAALRSENDFEIILMRRGYPVHYSYRIESSDEKDDGG